MTPSCPICGVADPRPPDGLGVQRCSDCEVEFRPATRVAIRRAAITTNPRPLSQGQALIIVAVVIGGFVGLSFALDAALPDRGRAQIEDFPTPIHVQPLVLPPPTFDSYAPLAPIALRHELHVSQLGAGRLFVTGVLEGDGVGSFTDLVVEARCRDVSGNQLAAVPAVLACARLGPEQTCAWMVEAAVAAEVSEFEVVATGVRDFGLDGPQLELDGDEIRFDPDERRVVVEVPARVADAWVAITARDQRARVIGVARTEVGTLEPGARRLEVDVPERGSEPVSGYELRVGGDLRELGF